MTEYVVLFSLFSDNTTEVEKVKIVFDIVNSDPVWLTQSVSEWESDPDYLEVKEFVSTVKVVNDRCERAVAMATDYVKILTKDSSMRRKILQVVEADRRAYTDCNKATLEK